MEAGQNAIEISANSVEQAVVRAAGQLGAAQDRIAYELVKKRGAFFSLFAGDKVHIRAWLKTEENQSNHARGRNRQNANQARPTKAAPRQQTETQESRELTPSETLALRQELEGFCSGICERMIQAPVKVTSKVEDSDRLIINIESEELANLIAKNSKIAEALEHLLRKKPSHLQQQLPFRIFVDVGGIRRQREMDLVKEAQDLSTKVAEKKRPIVLNYKSSYDRKIIHMALDKDNRVYTKSIGSGPNRKLMILPIKEGQAVDRQMEEATEE